MEECTLTKAGGGRAKRRCQQMEASGEGSLMADDGVWAVWMRAVVASMLTWYTLPVRSNKRKNKVMCVLTQ